jgi:hypothetical protein
MKSCPSCQQVYTDEGPEFCLNDGTPLVRTFSEYNPGASYASQWQQPTQGWQPQPPGAGHPPAPQYPPYGYGPAPSGGRGGEGVSKAALFVGLGSAVNLLLVFLIVATSHPSRDARMFVGLLAILSLISGLAAIILGIVSLSMASRNPANGKAKGIVGLCLGAIPVLLMLIGIIAASRRF